jgi:hypothetical protein
VAMMPIDVHTLLTLLGRYLDNHCANADAEGMSVLCECRLCLETRAALAAATADRAEEREALEERHTALLASLNALEQQMRDDADAGAVILYAWADRLAAELEKHR